ncbi:uncharacterized protein [Ptychodera flava]|uniref:uncharacterized protein n=1 Tax=Ptychodera flava TaxID=63121 RepID=UPI00396A0512
MDVFSQSEMMNGSSSFNDIDNEIPQDKASQNASHIPSVNDSRMCVDFICKDIISDLRNLMCMGLSVDYFSWSSGCVGVFLTFVNKKFGLENHLPDLANTYGIDGYQLFSMSKEQYQDTFNNYSQDIEMITGYVECWKTVLELPGLPKANIIQQVTSDGVDQQFDLLKPNREAQVDYHFSDSDGDVSADTHCCNEDALHKDIVSDIQEKDRQCKPAKRKRGRPRKERPDGGMQKKKRKHLWQFLLEHLDGGEFKHCVRWINRSKGLFRFVSKEKETIAKQWGKEKGHKKIMTYQKMARALRNYYTKKTLMEKCDGKLHYKFRPDQVLKT